jgi:phosphoglycolate phosphatase-like HAD superfamily hydrolase
MNRSPHDQQQQQHNQQLPLHIQPHIQLVVFDLDGVITSETRYWDVLRLTLWDMFEGEAFLNIGHYFGFSNERVIGKRDFSDATAPDSLLFDLKKHGINSNWDKTFVLASLHLISVLSAWVTRSPENRARLQNIVDGDEAIEQKLHTIGTYLREHPSSSSSPSPPPSAQAGQTLIEHFLAAANGLTGAEFLTYVQEYAAQTIQVRLPLEPRGQFWQLCYNVFQQFYTGHAPPPYLSLLSQEGTVIAREEIEHTLQRLASTGQYTLGIATGRPRTEVVPPLQSLALLHYFEEQRIITYDHVLDAEAALAQAGQQEQLGKPHPFVLYKAIHPDRDALNLCRLEQAAPRYDHVVFIGDAASDILAARRAGCLSIGVLSDIGDIDPDFKEQKRQELYALGAAVVLESIRDLPQALGCDA